MSESIPSLLMSKGQYSICNHPRYNHNELKASNLGRQGVTRIKLLQKINPQSDSHKNRVTMMDCPVNHLLDSSLVHAYTAHGCVTSSECRILVMTRQNPSCRASHTNQVSGEDTGTFLSSHRVVSEPTLKDPGEQKINCKIDKTMLKQLLTFKSPTKWMHYNFFLFSLQKESIKYRLQKEKV